jgi:pullulanase/glycogen debranching enzyme
VDARADEAGDVLVAFNADASPVDLVLPAAAHGDEWRMVLDTEQPDGEAKPLVVRCKETLHLAPRCTVLFESQPLTVDA